MSSTTLSETTQSNNEKANEGTNPASTSFISNPPFELYSLEGNQQINGNINLEKNFKIQSERKSGINYMSQMKIALHGQGISLQEASSENKNCLNLQNIGDSNNFDRYSKTTNLLESTPLKCPIIQPLSIPQQYHTQFYPYLDNYFTNKNLIEKKLFVSHAFWSNCIYDYQIPSYPILLRIPNIPKPEFKTEKIEPKKEVVKKINAPKKEEPKILIKLFFDIPDDFLLEFELKEIKVEKIHISEVIPNQTSTKKISFKDMEVYINNLSKKILNKNIIRDLINFGDEYIEYEGLNKDEKNSNFLQRKRKPSRDLSEESLKSKIKIALKDFKIKKHPLKKKCKKKIKKITRKLYKINNRKNGNYISVNLNQIQTQKTKIQLDKFPLHPLLNTKEVRKISFLKGLSDRKDLIKVNKKKMLFKEYNNINLLNNRRFKLIYQKDNGNCKYVMFINGLNILNLILYYYYQIHKIIKQMNAFHYAHAALYKSIFEVNKLEKIIKKCNALANEI